MGDFKVDHYNKLTEGGAAIAVFDLIRSLDKEGITSRLITSNVTQKNTRTLNVKKYGFLDSKLQSLINYNYRKQLLALRNKPNKNFEYFGNSKLHYKTYPFLDTDVIHLHWISDFIDFDSFFSIIPHNFPVVWTLHDNNPFTGGCHCNLDCRRFEYTCYSCPQLNNNTEKDLSYINFNIKLKHLRRLTNVHIVCSSKYMMDKVKNARIFSNAKSKSLFPLFNSRISPPKKHFPERVSASNIIKIGFGSTELLRPVKGLVLLLDVLNEIVSNQDLKFELYLFGKGKIEQKTSENLKIIYFGSLQPDHFEEFYDTIDFYAFPSLDDSFGQVMLESLLFGCPVVCNPVGGYNELIIDKFNGIVSKNKTFQSYKDAINQAINIRSNFDRNAISSHIKNITARASVGNDYVNLYEKAILNFKHPKFINNI